MAGPASSQPSAPAAASQAAAAAAAPPEPPLHVETDAATRIQEGLDQLLLACFNALLDVSKATAAAGAGEALAGAGAASSQVAQVCCVCCVRDLCGGCGHGGCGRRERRERARGRKPEATTAARVAQYQWMNGSPPNIPRNVRVSGGLDGRGDRADAPGARRGDRRAARAAPARGGGRDQVGAR